MNGIFEIEFAAADASVVPAYQMKGVKTGDPVWIISRTGQSIFMIITKGMISHYAVYTGEYLIERKFIGVDNVFKVFKIEGEYENPLNYKGSQILIEEAPTEKVYGIAKQFVGAVKGLSDEQRMEIEIDLLRVFRPTTA